MGKTVHYTPPKRPPMTDEERKELLRLSDQQDDSLIDFSDIPLQSPEEMRKGVRGRFFRPVKEQITLRLDANILDWFKRRTPKGYQTDINRALQDYIAAQDKKAG